MWAQLLKARIKPGKEADVLAVFDQLDQAEQPGSGIIRTTVLRDQKDPNLIYMMPVFENEAKARERERDPRRQEAVKQIQAAMADMFEGPPEFVDLDVLREGAF